MDKEYRNLTVAEIEALERAGNHAYDWQQVLVADPFCTECVRGNTFDGSVHIGALEEGWHLDMREGIYRSMLKDCTIGDHPAIHDVRRLEGYTVGDHVTLQNIGELTAARRSERSLFPMNENGKRSIKACPEMTVGDAYLWARYRGRATFMERLDGFCRPSEEEPCRIGDCCEVRNTNIIRNVDILSRGGGDSTCIDGCVALEDGVVGYGCKVGFGVIAERFLLGENVHLENGLRLNDSVVGDNSTLARCEVGSSIVFPAHEQHHNNSFLIAGLVMGQSNIAAGATVGSNHNSRSADGELAAGRGFWPGLCCSFKHSSRFASYCLVAKGDYPHELDIKLPFALVNNNVAENQLEVMPAYWWMYNMYALDRTGRKFVKRDMRNVKTQHIEFDPLAPDTVEEIMRGIDLLKGWLTASHDSEVRADEMEAGRRKVVVLKAQEGLKAYEDMALYYAMKQLTAHFGDALPSAQPAAEREWVNIGGQLVAKSDIEQLISLVEKGSIGCWEALHDRMDVLWSHFYPGQRTAHAYDVLCRLAGTKSIDAQLWQQCLTRFTQLEEYVARQVVASRQKDMENSFRQMTCWEGDERRAVLE